MPDPRPDPLRTAPHDPVPSTPYDPMTWLSAADPPLATPIPAIPGYEITGELGRGGMGVVYRAWQLGLNRDVAIKTVLRTDLPAAAVARFWAEAEVMAAVRHPNVVQVFELGEHDGRPFLAMELVTGGSLADRLADGRLTPHTAAELMEPIARGVAAAHDLGVVHRDLKPGNVLLAADGTPKVSDFGLAKWRSTDLTQTQAVMGTPAYMAPEQAAGRAKFVGPPADVWALGVSLYECVAGRRPFDGDTRDALLSQIQSAEPPALRVRGRSVPRDFDTIVAKCLAKEPGHRYPTAGELADDLARFARGEPIAARPVSRAERLVRWVRRKPTAAAAYGFSALAAVLALVTSVVLGFWRDAERSRDAEEGAKRNEEVARGKVEDLLRTETKLRKDVQTALTGEQTARRGEAAAKKEVERERDRFARVGYGRTTWAVQQLLAGNRIGEARDLLARTRPDLRGWEYDYLHRLGHADLVTLRGGWVSSAGWSPDGSKILTDHSGPRVWDANFARVLVEYPPMRDGREYSSWSPDGTRVLTVAAKSARVWNPATGKGVADIPGGADVARLASWSPDGSKILTCDGRAVRVWDAATGKPVTVLKGTTARILSATWQPGGTKLLTTGDDGAVVLWDAATGKTVAELDQPTKRKVVAAWSPDGVQIATGRDGAVRVWDGATGRPAASLQTGARGPVTAVAWSRDGTRVLAASHDATVRVWDANSNPVSTLQGHAYPVAGFPNRDHITAAAFSPDGKRVLTAGLDRTARVWETATGKSVAELQGHSGPVEIAAWSPDGAMVLTADEKTARVWDAAGKPLAVHAHADKVFAAYWSPDGTRVLTAGLEGAVRVWPARSLAGPRELRQTGEIERAAWSPDGSRILTHSRSGPALWDAVAEKPLTTFQEKWNPNDRPSLWQVVSGKRLPMLSMPAIFPARLSAWSRDGAWIVTVDTENVVRLWDGATGQYIKALFALKIPAAERFPFLGKKFGELPTAQPPDNEITAVRFDRTGTKVVTVSRDRTVREWDADTGKLLSEGKGSGQVASPDGTKVLSHTRATVRVSDAKTANVLAEFRVIEDENADGILNAVWSPDGMLIATTDGSPSIPATSHARTHAQVWDASTGTLVAQLRGHNGQVRQARWNRDGTKLLTTSDDRTVRVWNPRTGESLAELRGHTGWIWNAAWSRDESRIFTVGDDSTVRVWDAESGTELLTLPGTGFATFSPDGTRLLTRSTDKTSVLIYDSRPVNRAFVLPGSPGK